jgi:hypothetical protein
LLADPISVKASQEELEALALALLVNGGVSDKVFISGETKKEE